jgi:hypothetical protein
MKTIGRSMMLAGALAVGFLGFGATPARAQAVGFGFAGPGGSFGFSAGGYGGYGYPGYGYGVVGAPVIVGAPVVVPGPVVVPRPFYGGGYYRGGYGYPGYGYGGYPRGGYYGGYHHRHWR